MSIIDLKIRSFKPSDTKEIIKLFRDTVHAINIRHYTPEQVAVWAPEDMDVDRWQKSLKNNITYVAEIDLVIVGFADMTHEGYFDRLYVHKDYQARGVGYALFKQIEKSARELGLAKITTHCSISAKKLAERMGFVVIKEQIVVRKNVELKNYVMEKKL